MTPNKVGTNASLTEKHEPTVDRETSFDCHTVSEGFTMCRRLDEKSNNGEVDSQHWRPKQQDSA